MKPEDDPELQPRRVIDVVLIMGQRRKRFTSAELIAALPHLEPGYIRTCLPYLYQQGNFRAAGSLPASRAGRGRGACAGIYEAVPLPFGRSKWGRSPAPRNVEERRERR